eukprot:m.651651 g.651651  ORF g.651651 m.651651 type:complete len:947 (+) comp22679_c0_seq3:196-3036(+)
MGDVKVVVRFRPQQERELLKGGLPVCKFDSSGKTVSMNGTKKAAFTFDRVFNMDTTQEMIYEYAAKPIVEDVLKGYNGTIFAYGQTSSGKTFTMEGPDIAGPDRGVIPRIVENIFSYIEIAPESFEFTVRISYFEIYMEKIRDLLCDGNDNLQIHENRERGVYIRHATELYMQSPEEVLEVMRAGAERRSTAGTNMNERSSRSHAVVLLELTQNDVEKGGSKTGKLYLVDLAGSEKVSKTGADGDVLMEAKNINKSLSALGLVIMTLTDGDSRAHIPYRDSKLTRILQESLGGNSRTTIIICCSPSSWNEQESLSSLQFGKRAKKIKNFAKVNVQYSAEELQRQLEEAKKEIAKLVSRLNEYEKELMIWRDGGTVSEAERATLAASGNIQTGEDESGGGVTVGANGLPVKASAEVAALADEERESFMQRESELLDLLDDKDEEIRQLEREVSNLGEDHVTITKLAGENLSQKEQITAYELQIEQLQADNDGFEENLEEMVRANESLDLEIERITNERDELIASMTQELQMEKEQIKRAAECLNLLAIEDGTGSGRQLPQTPGTAPLDAFLDGAISKTRSRIADLRSEAEKLRANQAALSKQELQEREVAFAQKITAAELVASQAEKRLADALAEKEELDRKLVEEEGKLEEREKHFKILLEQLLEAEQKLEELGEQQSETVSSEVKELREQQHRQQQELNNKVLALRSEVETLKASNADLVVQKDQMERELKQAQGDLEKERLSVANIKSQLVEVTAKEEKQAEVKAIVDATNLRLEQFRSVKANLRRQMLQKRGSENIVTPSGDKRLNMLKDKLKEKEEELSAVKADNRALRLREAKLDTSVSEKERLLEQQRIKYRKQADEMVAREKRYFEKMEQQDRQLKSQKNAVPRQTRVRPVVRGGGGGQQRMGGGSQDASKFWSNETRRGTSMAKVVSAAEDLEQVQYV